ncbi:MAG: NAD-dependent epimerase/dehydratase family protein, partial [Chloroflexota bacterium]
RGQTNAPLPASVQHIHGEHENMDDFRETFRAFGPDVVVHMLLMEQGDTTRMLRVFRGVAPRVIVISSVDVYRAWGRLLNTEPGDIEPMPLTENSPLREESYPYRKQVNKDWRYYYDKLMVEAAALQVHRPASTVLRLPMVYGEHDYQKRIAGYVRRMADGRSHIFIDERMANWRAPRAYIDNAAHAVMCLVNEPKTINRIYHVAEPHTAALTEIEWVQAIGRAAGWDGEIVPMPSEKLPRDLKFNPRGQDVVLDSTRIREEAGFDEVVAFEDGLQRTVAWDVENTLPEMKPMDYTAEDALISEQQ